MDGEDHHHTGTTAGAVHGGDDRFAALVHVQDHPGRHRGVSRDLGPGCRIGCGCKVREAWVGWGRLMEIAFALEAERPWRRMKDCAFVSRCGQSRGSRTRCARSVPSQFR
jgi:hypothetical protein